MAEGSWPPHSLSTQPREDGRAFTGTGNEQSCGSCPCDLGAITKVTNAEFSSVTVKAICCFHRSPQNSDLGPMHNYFFQFDL